MGLCALKGGVTEIASPYHKKEKNAKLREIFETKYATLRKLRKQTNIMIVGSPGSGRTTLTKQIEDVVGSLINMRVKIFDTHTVSDKDILDIVIDSYLNGMAGQMEVELHGIIITVTASKISVLSRIVKLFSSIKQLVGPYVRTCIFFTHITGDGIRLMEYLCSNDSPLHENRQTTPVYYIPEYKPGKTSPGMVNYTTISMIEDIVEEVHGSTAYISVSNANLIKVWL